MLSTSPTEMLTMKTNLIENYYLCADNNEKFDRGETTFKMDLHEYSVYDYQQLVAKRMGAITMPFLSAAQVPPACRTRSIPSSFNWADYGVLTPVKDQLDCGCCWIFGSVAAIESAIAIKYGKLMKLSEQELLECITDPTNSGYAGCRGGGDNWVYNHLKNVGGVTMEYNYGYLFNDKIQCNHNARVKVPESKVVDYVSLTAGDEENLKYHLATVGPIAVAIYMSPSMSSFSYGIFDDPKNECANYQVNHLVRISCFTFCYLLTVKFRSFSLATARCPVTEKLLATTG